MALQFQIAMEGETQTLPGVLPLKRSLIDREPHQVMQCRDARSLVVTIHTLFRQVIPIITVRRRAARL